MFTAAYRGAVGTIQRRGRAKSARLNRAALSAEEILGPNADNRMISWPYTKLMNSNNMVDQGAAIILAAAEKATHLQIPTERWVFPYAGTDSHDTYAVGERLELSESPAIRIGVGGHSNWPVQAWTTSI